MKTTGKFPNIWKLDTLPIAEGQFGVWLSGLALESAERLRSACRRKCSEGVCRQAR